MNVCVCVYMCAFMVDHDHQIFPRRGQGRGEGPASSNEFQDTRGCTHK